MKNSGTTSITSRMITARIIEFLSSFALQVGRNADRSNYKLGKEMEQHLAPRFWRAKMRSIAAPSQNDGVRSFRARGRYGTRIQTQAAAFFPHSAAALAQSSGVTSCLCVATPH